MLTAWNMQRANSVRWSLSSRICWFSFPQSLVWPRCQGISCKDTGHEMAEIWSHQKWLSKKMSTLRATAWATSRPPSVETMDFGLSDPSGLSDEALPTWEAIRSNKKNLGSSSHFHVLHRVKSTDCIISWTGPQDQGSQSEDVNLLDSTPAKKHPEISVLRYTLLLARNFLAPPEIPELRSFCSPWNGHSWQIFKTPFSFRTGKLFKRFPATKQVWSNIFESVGCLTDAASVTAARRGPETENAAQIGDPCLGECRRSNKSNNDLIKTFYKRIKKLLPTEVVTSFLLSFSGLTMLSSLPWPHGAQQIVQNGALGSQEQNDKRQPTNTQPQTANSKQKAPPTKGK